MGCTMRRHNSPMKRSMHKISFNKNFNAVFLETTRSGDFIHPDSWISMMKTLDSIAGARVHWTKEERVEVLVQCRRRINGLILRIQMQEFEDPFNPPKNDD